MRYLCLTRGSAGCGKSTWLSETGLDQYAINVDTVRLMFQSPVMDVNGKVNISQKNDGKVWQFVRQLIEERMKRGELTIVDATHSRTSLIQDYKKLCEKYRYRCVVIEFDNDAEKILEQNRNRPELKRVPEDVIRNMVERFATQPTPNWCIKTTPDKFLEEFGKVGVFDFNKYEKVVHFGDIHGCYEPLKEYFEKHPYNENWYYIFTGDYVDRGIQNKETLEFLFSFLDKKNVLFLEGNHECIHKDSDLLTESGWMNIADVYNTSSPLKLAQFDENRNITFDYPLNKIKKQVDNVIRIESFNTCQVVTPNHDIFYKGKKVRALDFIKEEGKEQKYFYLSGTGNQNGIKLDNSWIKLLTWIVCDGCIMIGNNYNPNSNKIRIQFKLSINEKIEKLVALLKELNIQYTFRKATMSGDNKLQPYMIRIYGDEAKKIYNDLLQGKKEFPRYFVNINKSQSIALFQAIEDTDGHRASYNRLCGSTINKNNIDVLQELCIKNEFNFVYKYKENDKGYSRKGIYEYRIYYDVWNDKKVETEIVDYNDFVYCFQMPKGTLISRYNGKIAFTGNCHLRKYSEDNIEEIRSKEFSKYTIPQIENIDKKLIREFCRRLGQLALYEFSGGTFFVCHGGYPAIPTPFTASDEMILGAGKYEDYLIMEGTWNSSTEENQYLIHGHRNTENTPVEFGRTYNLCDKIEFGGNLRVLTLSKPGTAEVELIKNNTFFINEFPEKEKVVIDESSILESMMHNKLINVKQLGDNIVSLNFTRDAFFDKKWNDLTVRARGLFVNTENKKIVARSYEKFFNFGESDSVKLPELRRNMVFPAKAYLKYNGYLGIVGYNEEKDELFIATKTTNHGDMQKQFEALLTKTVSLDKIKTFCKDNNQSLIFEVIDPINDPHIIDYDNQRIVLLDCMDRTWEFNKSLDVFAVAKEFGIEVKEETHVFNNFNEFFDFTQNAEKEGFVFEGEFIEGFVVEDANGFMLKFKTEYYKFWKFMRSIKEKLAKGHEVKTSWFITAKQNSVYAFMRDKGREYCDAHSIIEIRKDYLAGQ